MYKMDTTTAESVFEKIIASKRKLTVRNWDSEEFKDEKEEILKLIRLRVLTWDDSKRQIIYTLEEPMGKIETVDFLKRDSVKMKQDALKNAKTAEEKGTALVCLYADMKLHQFVELSSSDEGYIDKIVALFLV